MQIVHQSKPAVPRDRFIRLGEVENLLGVKKSTIYEMIKKGEFIKPIRFSARAVVWPETSVLAFIQNRINQAETSNATQPQPVKSGANVRKASVV